MTPIDDTDLIERLHSGLAERVSEISAPAGIGEYARHIARKRTATRAAFAGVPVLAAAGVATVLATGSGPGSVAAGHPGASGSALASPPGPVKSEDTAYIVKRVRDTLAADTPSGMVIHLYVYKGGQVNSDGTLASVGPKLSNGYDYAAADGRAYLRDTLYNADGSVFSISSSDLTPAADGKYDDTRILISPADRSYSQTRFQRVSFSSAYDGSDLTLQSTPSQVQQALQSGQVTQMGITTVDGRQAIALSIKLPAAAAGDHLTLYVDAHTYQPLRTVTSVDGQPGLLINDWMPATADNIAMAEDDSVPTGYTKVKSDR